jgi:predicted  nucleic acid-binding Zn-ribbon protein
MSDETNDGLRERLQRSGEDALGRLAQDLLDNPLVTGAIARAFEAREKAAQAQELAMGALNLPSAADLERLTRRLRSVSQRLEGIEDGVDRLDERLAALAQAPRGVESLEERLDTMSARLDVIETKLDRKPRATPAPRGTAKLDDRLHTLEEQLGALTREVHALRGELPGAPAPLPREQERLKVEGGAG